MIKKNEKNKKILKNEVDVDDYLLVLWENAILIVLGRDTSCNCKQLVDYEPPTFLDQGHTTRKDNDMTRIYIIINPTRSIYSLSI